MKPFVVFDTNVIVSALISKHVDTAVVLSLEILLSGKVVPLYNDEIIQEYNNVLHREKFLLPDSLVDSVIKQIESNGLAVERVHSEESFPDPTDIVFYEVALSKSGSFLVTGNIKHFPKNPIVVTPSEFLRIIGVI